MDASEIVSRYLDVWLREIPEGNIIKMRDLAREAAEAMVHEVRRLTLEELKK